VLVAAEMWELRARKGGERMMERAAAAGVRWSIVLLGVGEEGGRGGGQKMLEYELKRFGLCC
jgi:hypothetical protein